MKRHDLKCWPEFFADVTEGRKTFEVRYDDRAIDVGDVLVLHEFDPNMNQATGLTYTAEVTYRLRLADAPGFPADVPCGGIAGSGEWVVFGIAHVLSAASPSPSPLEGTQA